MEEALSVGLGLPLVDHCFGWTDLCMGGQGRTTARALHLRRGSINGSRPGLSDCCDIQGPREGLLTSKQA